MATQYILVKTRRSTNGGTGAPAEEQARVRPVRAGRARLATAQPHGARLRGLSLAGTCHLFGGRSAPVRRAVPGRLRGHRRRSRSRRRRSSAAAWSPRGPAQGRPDYEESGFPARLHLPRPVHSTTTSRSTRQQPEAAERPGRADRLPHAEVRPGLRVRPRARRSALPVRPRRTLLLGKPLTGDALGHPTQRPHDLARAPNSRAIIGDPRNDENAIVSQFQGLVLRFHNIFATDNPDLTFEQVQQQVRFHYQWVVLHDFLQRSFQRTFCTHILPHLFERNDDKANVVDHPRTSIL